jgi:phospholipid/cholesterol/gamma-HCH transport system ATP-binding protein
LIEVRNISKTFGENLVLSDISVTFEQGRTNLIIGKSGSGKTVLLKSIVGLHDVDEGQIFFNDRNFTRMSFKEKKNLRKEFGMLFQGAALFDSCLPRCLTTKSSSAPISACTGWIWINPTSSSLPS